MKTIIPFTLFRHFQKGYSFRKEALLERRLFSKRVSLPNIPKEYPFWEING